jgi:hypothetical protein
VTKYLLKQVGHQWRYLGWRVKVELIIIAGILVMFISNKLGFLFTQWHTNYSISFWRITLFTSYIIIGTVYFASIFLFAYMLPRHKALRVFFTKPLSMLEKIQLLCFHVLKYHLLYIILLFPISIALAAELGWIYMFSANLLIISACLILVLFQCLLLMRLGNQIKFIGTSFITGIFLVTFWLVLFWYLNFGLSFMILMYSIFATFIFILYKNDKFSFIEDFLLRHSRNYSQKTKVGSKRRLILIQSGSILQAMFWKEWYGVWRNPRYRRLKLITLLVFISGLTAFLFTTSDNSDIWALFFLMIVIWFHYSSVFNEKYIQPDPVIYFKLRPVRFYQFWLSKFLPESIYAFLLILIFHLFLQITNISIGDQIHLLGICILFTVFVLGSMVTFRLMFFESPRMAGYAYHFMLLFIVIMSVNFRLVGPLIGLGLMIFYLYKSYCYFRL